MRGNPQEPTRFGSFDALHHRALAVFRQGQLDEAEQLCEKARLLRPADVGILNLLGQIYLAQKRLEASATCFERAVKFNPKLANLHFNLALARQAQGRIGDAINSVEVAISLEPEVPMLHAKLGQLQATFNQPERAVESLRKCLELDPNSIPVRLNLSQALCDLGRLSEAEVVGKSVIALNPQDANAYRLLGRIFQLSGDFENAIKNFERAIELQPDQAPAYYAIAYSKKVGPVDRPFISRMELLAETIDDPGEGKKLLHYAIAKSFDDLGEYDRAIEHFDVANRLALDEMRAAGRSYEEEREELKVQRLIEQFSLDFLDHHRDQSHSGARPIFIVGMIRSGTTLVEQILSRHPAIEAAGELGYWVQNVPKMLLELVEEPQAAPDTGRWRSEYEAVLDSISRTSPHITDKMPLNFWALGFIHLAYPHAKIIHVKRDPRDNCISIFLTPFRVAPDFGHDRAHIVHAYHEYQRLMAHWKSVLPASSMVDLEYADLVSNPEANIRAMVEFIGLEWTYACLDPEQSQRAVNTPSQWQVRQPIYRKSVNRWQNYAPYLGPIHDV